MIKPLNDHVLIEPVAKESFMYSEQTTYEEVGVVIDLPPNRLPWPHALNAINSTAGTSVSASGIAAPPRQVGIGDKVYFDSWLAAKFPKNDTEFYWLVPFSSIKGYEPLSTE